MNIDSLPYENIYSILLSLPYQSVMSFCLTCHDYYHIWLNTNFWSLKANYDLYHTHNQDGIIIKTPITHQQFNSGLISPNLRYIQLLYETLTKCERGTHLFINVDTCLIMSAFHNDLSLVKYFIDKGSVLRALQLILKEP